MEPIGLTLKDETVNPFTGRRSGELMIVHRCTACGRISCNRIAGDDNTESIRSLIGSGPSAATSAYPVRLLTGRDMQLITDILFGIR